MGKSTFISAALHVALLLFVLVSIPSSSSMTPLVAVPVDLATHADITKLKAGMKDAKDDAPLAGKPEEQKQEAVKEKSTKEKETSPPQPTDAEKRPEPKQPEPKKEEPKKAAAKPKPEPKKEEPKKAEAKPKEKQAEKPKPKPDAAAKKKASDFDTDRIAALLNKIPDASNDPMPNELAEETKPVRGQTSGRELSLSVNDIDALRARIAQCWSPPPGGLGAGDIVVKVRLKLNEDGTLTGYPTVANSGSSPFFQAAADSAVRAVYQCQPYALPADKYAQWRDMILNFDPSDMYRSG
jgi:outer membrane biosynthesis protein TonB